MAISVEKEKIVDVNGNTKTAEKPGKRIEVPPTITVRDLASLMKVSPIDVIRVLMSNGIMANINQQIDFDTASIIGEDMGYEIVPPPVEEPKETQEVRELPYTAV